MSGKNVYKWSAIDRIVNSAMTLGGNIFLARMLDPSDFGLLGMVAIFTALAYNISGCGMSDGLINKKNPTKHDYSTVFVFNAAIGLFFAVLFIVCSGLIADFFGYVELKGIMIASGVCFFFHALSQIQETKMRKELDFKNMAIVRLSSTACSLILAVVLVLNGYGYWGLVSMQIFLSFFLFVFYTLVSRWFPRLAFYRNSFKEMFGYGVHLMVSYLCFQVARNINTTVLGKFSPAASSSGAYNQGQKLEEVPFALSEAILNWPFFSVLASTPDLVQRRALTARMHGIIIFVNATIACLLFTVSSYFFNAVYGSKWDIAIPVFNILLIFGFATAMKMFYQTILKIHARTKTIRNLTFAEVLLQLSILALFYRSDIETIAFTQVIPVLVVLLIYIYLYIRLEEIDLRSFAKESLAPVLMPAVIMAMTIALTVFWAPAVNSFIALAVVLSVYLLLMLAACECFKPKFYIELRKQFIKKHNAGDR